MFSQFFQSSDHRDDMNEIVCLSHWIHIIHCDRWSIQMMWRDNLPISLDTWTNFDSLRAINTIFMPRSANCFAYSFPIPSVLPVTTKAEKWAKKLSLWRNNCKHHEFWRNWMKVEINCYVSQRTWRYWFEIQIIFILEWPHFCIWALSQAYSLNVFCAQILDIIRLLLLLCGTKTDQITSSAHLPKCQIFHSAVN